ncbi:FmdB family zinc ribbon protein [Desulfosediminicola flagellatus]|uniref:FmdB family zinc ribbon protein n=1 Tax=Desulfosediminicola flagellatus TaxID=2569541 RepID=UPI0010ABA875
MPIYKIICKSCGKVFDKILPSSDLSSVTCSACGSPEIKRVFSEVSSTSKGATTIPAGALSGSSCKSGFS